MALSKMEDIGGVRAVLRAQGQVDAIRHEIERQKRWTVRRVRDYIAQPKEDGYRAIHVIVERLVSEMFAMRERDEEPDTGFMEQLAKQFVAVRDYFPERE